MTFVARQDKILDRVAALQIEKTAQTSSAAPWAAAGATMALYDITPRTEGALDNLKRLRDKGILDDDDVKLLQSKNMRCLGNELPM